MGVADGLGDGTMRGVSATRGVDRTVGVGVGVGVAGLRSKSFAPGSVITRGGALCPCTKPLAQATKQTAISS